MEFQLTVCWAVKYQFSRKNKFWIEKEVKEIKCQKPRHICCQKEVLK